MTTSDLVHLRTPPRRLQPGEEWWVDHKWQLLARIRADVNKGRIQPMALREIAPGLWGALVVRLKPRPPAWRKRAVLLAAVASFFPMAIGVVMLTVQLVQWAAAYAVPVLLVLAVVWCVVRSSAGHSVTCAGLHCSGCKG